MKRKYFINCGISIVCFLLVFAGIDDFIETRDFIDIGIVIAFAIMCVINAKEAITYRANKQKETAQEIEQQSIIYTNTETSKIKYGKQSIDAIQTNFDGMEEHEFEHLCVDLLKRNHFKDIELIKGNRDHGIDILAEKDDITYAIQCKCYSSNIGNIGNSAVQQAHTGKSLYHKDIAVVLTNKYFTKQAKEDADVLGVKLWDRDHLEKMIRTSQ